MISIEKGLKHMAWSNQEIFNEVSKLPADIYGLRAAEGEWPVGKLLNHFVNAGEWFRFLLTGQKWSELPRITNSEILQKMKVYLGEIDQTLIAEASKPDAEIRFTGDDGKEEKATRSLVLTQALMHTAEHKGQLATILKAHGHLLDLDKYDLWNYESKDQ